MNDTKNRAKQLWGKDLHKDKTIQPHSPQFKNLFGSLWTNSLKGNLLEIGCGSGADLEIFDKINDLESIYAIDLGANIEQLAKRYKDKERVHVKSGDATSLDFESNTFDVVYSFGVFHHTEDPIKCFYEAFRVMKANGNAFIYLYSKHSNNMFKRIGIFFEFFLMKLIRVFPYRIQSFFCIILSPICWILFFLPSRLIYFLNFHDLSSKIPFYFASHPFSLIGDLKDRLMAPVNHRFNKLEIERVLLGCGFSEMRVIDNSHGIYICAKK